MEDTITITLDSEQINIILLALAQRQMVAERAQLTETAQDFANLREAIKAQLPANTSPIVIPGSML